MFCVICSAKIQNYSQYFFLNYELICNFVVAKTKNNFIYNEEHTDYWLNRTDRF